MLVENGSRAGAPSFLTPPCAWPRKRAMLDARVTFGNRPARGTRSACGVEAEARLDLACLAIDEFEVDDRAELHRVWGRVVYELGAKRNLSPQRTASAGQRFRSIRFGQWPGNRRLAGGSLAGQSGLVFRVESVARGRTPNSNKPHRKKMLSHMCTKSALITLNVVSFTTETIRGGRTGAGMAFREAHRIQYIFHI